MIESIFGGKKFWTITNQNLNDAENNSDDNRILKKESKKWLRIKLWIVLWIQRLESFLYNESEQSIKKVKRNINLYHIVNTYEDNQQ